MSESEKTPETLRIYLKGGQFFEIKVINWSLKKNIAEGRVTELSWEMADSVRMPFVCLDEIAAVLALGK